MIVRYLHLSDLHLSCSEKKGDKWAVDAFNQDLVMHSMIDAVKQLVDDGNKFDFLVITGDLAKKGRA